MLFGWGITNQNRLCQKVGIAHGVVVGHKPYSFVHGIF